MSRYFNHIFIHIFQNKIPIKFQFCLIGSAISSHGLYSYSTYYVDTIQIDKKYTYTKNANTEFMLIDLNGRHYSVSNNFWYWKWNSIEDWHKYKEKDFVKIKYYGYRIPFFGIFPNIIYIKNINDKDDDNRDYFYNYKYITPTKKKNETNFL
jgi:hypothetical protein